MLIGKQYIMIAELIARHAVRDCFKFHEVSGLTAEKGIKERPHEVFVVAQPWRDQVVEKKIQVPGEISFQGHWRNDFLHQDFKPAGARVRFGDQGR
jgi:hypothetical protein